ncbi:Glyceraldehyde-3-phosphate dehydrogenase [Plecturocebus cupreus]
MEAANHIAMAAFNSDKVTVNDPIIDLNYMVYMFPPDFTHGKFHGNINTENGKPVIDENPFIIFQE